MFTFAGLVAARAGAPDSLSEGRLQNGISYIINHQETAGLSSSIYCLFRTGSDNEPESLAGISHLIEHSVFQTLHMPENKTLWELFDYSGIKANAYTSNHYTCYFAVSFMDDQLPEICRYWSEAFFDPEHVDEESWAQEREVVCEEIALYRTSDLMTNEYPSNEILKKAVDLMVKKNPFNQWGPAGYSRRVADVSLTRLRRYQKSVYVPSCLTLYISSGLPRETIVQILQSTFGSHVSDHPAGPPASTAPDFLDKGFQMNVLEKTQPDQIQCALAFRIPPLASGEFPAIQALMSLLSKKFSSLDEPHFSIELLNLNLFAGPAPQLLIFQGDIINFAGGTQDDFFPLLKTIASAVNEIRTERLNDAAMEALRIDLKRNLSPPAADNLLLQYLQYGSLESFRKLEAGFDSLQPADLNAIAAKYLDWEKATFVITGLGYYLPDLQSIFRVTYFSLSTILPLLITISLMFSFQRHFKEGAAQLYLSKPVSRTGFVIAHLSGYLFFLIATVLAIILTSQAATCFLTGRRFEELWLLCPAMLPSSLAIILYFYGLVFLLKRPFQAFIINVCLIAGGNFSLNIQNYYQVNYNHPLVRAAISFIYTLLPKFDQIGKSEIFSVFGYEPAATDQILIMLASSVLLFVIGLVRFQRTEI
jgi:predicted Zn-dependent peptidase